MPGANHVNDLIARCDAAQGGLRAACAVELKLTDGPPDWVELIPAGTFDVRDSRGPFRNDDPEAVIEASRALAMDMPIDFEHQTEFAEKNGQPAPAAGWIKELAVRAGAIWGRVEWTERARAMLAAKEYRFLSPVFNHTKSLSVTRVLRAGLTNNPALFLTAITKMEESDMDPKLARALALLGLKDKASEDDIATAISKLTASETAIASIRGALKLGETVSAEDVAKALAAALEADGAGDLKAIAKAAGLADTATAGEIATVVAKAVAAGKPDPGEFVPRSEFDKVSTALAKLQADDAEEKATAAVDGAITEGKITPAQRDWAVGYAKTDAKGFADYVENAPVIVKPGPGGGNPPARKAGGPLDETEKAVCAMTGISEEDFKKSRDQLAGIEGEAA